MTDGWQPLMAMAGVFGRGSYQNNGSGKMQTPKNRVGRLTEHIMGRMPELEPVAYNRIYEAVLKSLQDIEDVDLVICPNNDQALWSKFVALSRKSKRAIIAAANELDEAG